MFSSLVSRVSPKSVLASYLASSLGEFFEVDPAAIEANLLSNTKIVLHDIKLKAQHTTHHTLRGGVDEIEFSWIWGGDDNTSFVRDARLSIRGARFRLVKVCEPQVETTSSPSLASSTSETSPSTTKSSTEQEQGYMQRLVQQIIDHLTLNIEDMELTIETGPEDVVLEAKSLQLVSFGYNEKESSSSPLSQRISLASLRVFVKGDDDEVLPLVDPFQYAASVKRVAGRRFVDGIFSGLEVVGEDLDNGGIVLHAGTEQVGTLNRLVEMLVPKDTAPTSPAESQSDVVTAEEQGSCVQDQDTSESIPTTFVMPFPSIELILPNNAKVRTPNCIVRYKMDGSLFCVESTEGVLINDGFHLVRLEDNAKWLVDFVENKILLDIQQSIDDGDEQWQDAMQDIEETTNQSGVVARVHWQEKEMKQLLDGFHKVMESSSPDLIEHIESTQEKKNTSASPWLISLNGTIAALIEGVSPEEFMEASLSSPFIVLSQETSGWTLKQLEMKGAAIGSRSFGDVRVSVPPLAMLADSNHEILLDGSLEVGIESSDSLQDAQKFLLRVLCLDTFQQSSRSFEGSSDLPFALSIPSVAIDVQEPKAKCTLNEVWLRDSSVSCQRVEYMDNEGTTACVSDVKIVLSPEMHADLNRIETLRIPGVLDLIEPIKDVKLNFTRGILYINTASAQVAIPQAKGGDNEKSNEGDISLPFPVRFGLKELSLKPQDNADCSVIVRSIDLSVSKMDKLIRLENAGDLTVRVVAPDDAWVDSTATDLSVMLTPSCDGVCLSAANCSRSHVGPSAFGHISIDIPACDLKSEQLCVSGDVAVALESFEVTNRILELLSLLKPQESPPPSQTSMGFRFALIVPRVTIDVRDLEASCTVHEIRLRDSEVCCSRAEYLEKGGSTACVSDLSIALLPEIHAELRQIETLCVPGALYLAEPITNVTLGFTKGVLHVNLSSAQVVATEKSSKPKEKGNAKDFSLPFPVRLGLKELRLKHQADTDCSVIVRSIDLGMSEMNKSIRFENFGDLSVRVEASDDDWLDSSVSDLTVILSPSNGGLCPSAAKCSRAHVGSSSYGQFSVDVPSIGMESDQISGLQSLSATSAKT